MLNTAILQGRLTRDIELRYTKADKAVASFSIACDRGNKEADFINCVAWNKTASFIAQYFAKGDMILIEGRLRQRTWEGDDGKKRSTLEVWVSNVNFCESRKKNAEPEYDGPPQLQEMDADESDLPF